MLWIDLLWPLAFAALALVLVPRPGWPRPGPLLTPTALAVLLPGLVSLGCLAWADLTTEDELSSLRTLHDPAAWYLISDKGLPSRLHRFLELAANLSVGQALVRLVHVGIYLGSGALLCATARRVGGGVAVALCPLVLWNPTWLSYIWESRAHALVLGLGTVAACATALALSAPGHPTPAPAGGPRASAVRSTGSAAPAPGGTRAAPSAAISAAVVALSLACLDNPVVVCGLLALGTVVLLERRGSRRDRMRWLGAGAVLGVGLLAIVLPAMANHEERGASPDGATVLHWLFERIIEPRDAVNLLPLLLIGALLPRPAGGLARVAVLGFALLMVPMATGTLPLQTKVFLWWMPMLVLALAALLPHRTRAWSPALPLVLLAPFAWISVQSTGMAALQEREEALTVLTQARGRAAVMPEFARTRLVSALVSTRWSRTPDLWQRTPKRWQRLHPAPDACPAQGPVVVDVRYEYCMDCAPLFEGRHWALRQCGAAPAEPEAAP